MDRHFWYLKNCELFSQLSAEQLAQLERVAYVREFSRKQLIYLPQDESEAMLLVARGRVRLYHLTPDGKEATLAIIDAGEVFGELGVFQAGMREEYAEAMEASQIVKIPGAEVRRLMENVPSLTFQLSRLMGLRRQRIERRLKSLIYRSNRDRLIYLLIELAEQYGRAHVDGILISIKLSHQELANIIGSTRETVTLLLGQLQEEGAVLIRRKQLILCRLSELAQSLGQPVPAIVSTLTPPELNPSNPTLRPLL